MFVIATVVLSAALGLVHSLQNPSGPATDRPGVVFEDDQIRVLRVKLAPQAIASAGTHPDQVVIFLTADLEGHMPAAEAHFEPAGSEPLQNKSGMIVEAVIVQFNATPDPDVPFLPEFGPRDEDGTVAVKSLVDNPSVNVSKIRMMPVVRTNTVHVHPRDIVVVYLTGGQMAGTLPGGSLYGRRARRGEVDVLPPYAEHEFGNLGNDPIEFVLIQTK
jgi:quercetin dioxygenase-like cupin family protein